MAYWIVKHTFINSTKRTFLWKKKKINFVSFSRRMMSEMNYIASIDQGTSSTRLIIYDSNGEKVITHQVKIPTISNNPGWAEQDPKRIIQTCEECMEEIYKKAENSGLNINSQNLKAVGITNHRESLIVWDKESGEPLYNCIVWSDTRTNSIADELIGKYGSINHFRKKTGLPISGYFTALKIKWAIDNVDDVKKAVEKKTAMFGTVDSWIIWNLTGGKDGGIFMTDVTNASRTMLMDLEKLIWSEEICNELNIPMDLLPSIRSSSEVYANIKSKIPLFDGVPIAGCLGDQQAALFGQKCFNAGEGKNTYGTGCFILYNTGTKIVESKNGLITTVAYQLGKDSEPYYALEGSISTAGSGFDWLVNLGIINSATDVDKLGGSVKNSGGLYFVPAFSGLFAPYWRSDARGVAIGLTNYTTKAHFVRAMIEAISFQTTEIIEVMEKDSNLKITSLKVDGGLSNSEVLMQTQSDILGKEVVKPSDIETTAKGAALVAGLAIGLFTKEQLNLISNSTKIYTPRIDEETRNKKLEIWKKAVQRSFDFVHEE